MVQGVRSFFPHSVLDGICSESSLRVFLKLMEKHDIKDLTELEARLSKEDGKKRIMAGPLRQPNNKRNKREDTKFTNESSKSFQILYPVEANVIPSYPCL